MSTPSKTDTSDGKKELHPWAKLFAGIVESAAFPTLKNVERGVLMVLFKHADFRPPHTCYPGTALLAEMVGTDRRNIQRAIRRLVELGFVEIVRVGKGEVTSQYHVLAPAEKRAKGGGIQTASPHARGGIQTASPGGIRTAGEAVPTPPKQSHLTMPLEQAEERVAILSGGPAPTKPVDHPAYQPMRAAGIHAPSAAKLITQHPGITPAIVADVVREVAADKSLAPAKRAGAVFKRLEKGAAFLIAEAQATGIVTKPILSAYEQRAADDAASIRELAPSIESRYNAAPERYEEAAHLIAPRFAGIVQNWILDHLAATTSHDFCSPSIKLLSENAKKVMIGEHIERVRREGKAHERADIDRTIEQTGSPVMPRDHDAARYAAAQRAAAALAAKEASERELTASLADHLPADLAQAIIANGPDADPSECQRERKRLVGILKQEDANAFDQDTERGQLLAMAHAWCGGSEAEWDAIAGARGWRESTDAAA